KARRTAQAVRPAETRGPEIRLQLTRQRLTRLGLARPAPARAKSPAPKNPAAGASGKAFTATLTAKTAWCSSPSISMTPTKRPTSSKCWSQFNRSRLDRRCRGAVALRSRQRQNRLERDRADELPAALIGAVAAEAAPAEQRDQPLH